MRLAIMQWEEKWKAMMSELGGDAKIPDLWRMSALLEICPKDVKEEMLVTGRNLRELREPHGEGDFVHVEQSRADARKPEGDRSADGA